MIELEFSDKTFTWNQYDRILAEEGQDKANALKKQKLKVS